MHSCIYVGSVRHRRFGDVSHDFGYRLWWSFVDLSEVSLLRDRGMLGQSRWAHAAWRADDHQQDDHRHHRVKPGDALPGHCASNTHQRDDGAAVQLADHIRDQIELETDRRPTGAVRMLTQLAHFGWYFSPLTLFYAYDGCGDDERLSGVVAEVNNTPWGEQHSYVLPLCSSGVGSRHATESGETDGSALCDRRSYGSGPRAAGGPATCTPPTPVPGAVAAPSRVLRATHEKSFHVSPFMQMSRKYVWRLGVPGERLSVHIDSLPVRSGELASGSELENRAESVSRFDATMLLKRRVWTRGSQLRCLVSKPLIPMWILGGIYLEALRLWWKGASFVPHPGKSTSR